MATLLELHQLGRNHSELRLKRELWAKVLLPRSAPFDDSDHLFIGHTYLVTVAELVAQAAETRTTARHPTRHPSHRGRRP